MRSLLVYALAVALPAIALGRQETFCQEKISHRGQRFSRPSYQDLEEAPGRIYITEDVILGEPVGGRFIFQGRFDEKTPVKNHFLGGLRLTFDIAGDFNGRFKGTIGQGQVDLVWESGATAIGYSDIGDYEVSGQTSVYTK